jgi:hypothetical protein
MLYIVIICSVFVVAVLFIRYRNLSLPTPVASTSDSRHVESDLVVYKRVGEFLSTTGSRVPTAGK